jgi:hypothetical protein
MSMGRFRSWSANSGVALALVFFLPPVLAVELPAGTEISLRLKSKVASNGSKVKDPVEATVIQPVIVNGQFVIPAGATVRGVVQEAKPATKPDERAILDIVFSELALGDRKLKLDARVAGVDNARESVGDKGEILGILASETISARLDAGIAKVTGRYSGLGGFLEAAKSAVLKQTESEILYEPGVELTLKLAQPLEVASAGQSNGIPDLQPVANEAELVSMVVRQPFQTMAQRPSKPSDITNLMFIGTEQQLQEAFSAAGWSSAAALSTQSKLETFRAIAELRGYKEAPVSILLLEDRPPDLVFQKQNNTFAMRHHLRIWRRPGNFHGQPVWVCAATHDTGIDFSAENRTFIHKIDPEIDRERAKVVNDLLLTAKVKSLALVDRPEVPKESANATGDKLITDGQMAVLIF